MRRVKVGAALVCVGALSLVFAAPVGAATPAVQACVGSTLSPLASSQPAPGAFGQGVRSFAQNSAVPGLGADIQALQAGLVPDDIVPNTCNG